MEKLGGEAGIVYKGAGLRLGDVALKFLPDGGQAGAFSTGSAG
jgi:hypothetical protein